MGEHFSATTEPIPSPLMFFAGCCAAGDGAVVVVALLLETVVSDSP